MLNYKVRIFCLKAVFTVDSTYQQDNMPESLNPECSVYGMTLQRMEPTQCEEPRCP
jgi:hypothetical protein